MTPEWMQVPGATIPNLSIEDIPEYLVEALRQRALRNHRSLESELMATIEEAVTPGSDQSPGLPSHSGEWRQGTRTVEETAAVLKALHPEPVPGPLAVDIIRQDRDNR